MTPDDVTIDILGRCLLPSPVAGRLGARGVHFVGAADKVLLDDSLSGLGGADAEISTQPHSVGQTRRVDTDGDLWMSVIEATGQPRALA